MPQPVADPSRKPSPALPPKPAQPEPPQRVFLVSYPKVIFLYPSFFAAIVAGIVASIVEGTGHAPLDTHNRAAVAVSVVFMLILAMNLVILAFDFPRTTSLTLFFFVAALALAMALLFTLKPHFLPDAIKLLRRFRPLANATFYWSFAGVLGLIFAAVLGVVRFDYWEVRPNELLHHHGFLSNLERLSAPNLRIDKEINDIFEFMLLRSGRLILQASNERRAIILDNVPLIERKEEAITRMLGALQVQIRPDA